MAAVAPGVSFLLYHTVLPVTVHREVWIALEKPRSDAYKAICPTLSSTTYHMPGPRTVAGKAPWEVGELHLVDHDGSTHSIAVNVGEATLQEFTRGAATDSWRPLTSDALSRWIQYYARVDDAELPNLRAEADVIRRLLDDAAARVHLFDWSNVFHRDGFGWIVALPDIRVRDRTLQRIAASGFEESSVFRRGSVAVVKSADKILVGISLLLWAVGMRSILLRKKPVYLKRNKATAHS